MRSGDDDARALSRIERGKYIRSTGGSVFRNGVKISSEDLGRSAPKEVEGFDAALSGMIKRLNESDRKTRVVRNRPEQSKDRDPRVQFSFPSQREGVLAAKVDAIQSQLGGYPRTFFTTEAGGTDVAVSAGTINNVLFSGIGFSGVADGDLVYIDATVTSGTDLVTSVTVSKGTSVPSDTLTHAYALIASISVTGGVATAVPLAWNYSQLQKCGSFRWGGFGS